MTLRQVLTDPGMGEDLENLETMKTMKRFITYMSSYSSHYRILCTLALTLHMQLLSPVYENLNRKEWKGNA